ncbi:MAG TPA: redoxin domain-containing protein [Lysobacter sp.]
MSLRTTVVVSMLIALSLVACKPSGDAPPQQAAKPAKPAPTSPAKPPQPVEPVEQEPADSAMPTLQIAAIDGNQYDLAAHRGKWVVVNFWATWCKPCVKEMPELSALDAMREHIEVVGLAYDDTAPDDLRAFLKKHPVVYPIAIVDTYDPPKAFATPRGLPMTYLIAPDGRMVKKFMGPVTAKEIEGEIAKAGGPAIPT